MAHDINSQSSSTTDRADSTRRARPQTILKPSTKALSHLKHYCISCMLPQLIPFPTSTYRTFRCISIFPQERRKTQLISIRSNHPLLEPRNIPPKHPIHKPISRNQNPVPPTDALSQIRATPDEPRHPSTDVAALALHDSVPVADISHDSQILVREPIVRKIAFVQPLREPVGFLRCDLRSGWVCGIFHDRTIAQRVHMFQHCAAWLFRAQAVVGHDSVRFLVQLDFSLQVFFHEGVHH